MLSIMSPLKTLVVILLLCQQAQAFVIPSFIDLESLMPIPTEVHTILPYPMHPATTKTKSHTLATPPVPGATSTTLPVATAVPRQVEDVDPTTPVSWHEGSHRKNICGSSSFISHTSSVSPLAADCLSLATALREQGGYFVARGFTDTTTLVNLATGGSCVFGVRPTSLINFHEVIGAVDAAEFLEDAVKSFSSPAEGLMGAGGVWVAGGLVGASGRTKCELDMGGKQELVWGIYAVGQEWDVGHVELPVDVPGVGSMLKVSLWTLGAMLASLAVFL
ncbi:hypothetical protein ACHAQH_001409 [Verticillium albo-atrum]